MKTSDRPYTIYAIQCTQTNRVYIGSTANFDARIKAHFHELRRGMKMQGVGFGAERTREKTQWQLDYDKYGEDSFKIFLIEDDVHPDEQGERESTYIQKYQAADVRYGYNIRPAQRPPIEYERGAPPLPQAAHA